MVVSAPAEQQWCDGVKKSACLPSSAHAPSILGRSAKNEDQGPTPSFGARLLLREFSHRINNEFASAVDTYVKFAID
jgi:hypothetical protein